MGVGGKRRLAHLLLRPVPILVACFLFVHFLAKERTNSSDNNISIDLAGSPDASVSVYKPTNSTSNVAICVILKNETLYLDEWIDYHIALGFSPIHIYDNSPDFELMTGLHSGIYSWYESREDVHEYIRLVHFPTSPGQHAAYYRCIKQDAANSTFVAMLDVDEFLVLKTFDNVVDFMDRHCNNTCGQLSVNWRSMGVSGEKRYTPVPVTKRNVHWSPNKSKQGTIKVIARPSYVADHINWRHSVMLKKGHWLDTNGKVHSWPVGDFRRMQNLDNPTDVAVLYHYSFKSEAEFHYKTCVRGTSAHKRGETPMCNNPDYYVIYNGTIFDDTAWKQLERMVPKYRVYGNAIPWNEIAATKGTEGAASSMGTAAARGRAKDVKRGTAIIQYDTRSVGVESGNYSYWQMSAKLNLDYAKRYGYQFIYLWDRRANDMTLAENMSVASDGVSSANKRKAQCYLQLPGKDAVPRGAPWCKLLAVASSLGKGFDTVVYIDSDAFFRADAPPLKTIIDKHSAGQSEKKPLLVADNAPWSPSRANSGLMIWNASAENTWALLHQWWKLDYAPQEHPYELEALFKMDWREACGVGVMKLPWMDKGQWDALPVVHVPSHDKHLRQSAMQAELERMDPVSSEELQGAVEVLESVYFERKLNTDTTDFVCESCLRLCSESLGAPGQ